jgi:hypothetical protein
MKNIPTTEWLSCVIYLMNALEDKDVQIERLKTEVEMMTTQAIKFRDMARAHAALCARAADALENFDVGKAHLGQCDVCKLIAQLRKMPQP